MKILNNPSDDELNIIQSYLEKDKEIGIKDIWVEINPIYFLAQESEEKVGVISLSVFDSFAEIYKLYVPLKFRRKNIARNLFSHTIDYLKAQGITEVGIELAGESHGFWRKIFADFKVQEHGDGKYILEIGDNS